MSDPLDTMALIMALRGGHPKICDFCGQPYSKDRWPVPEEAGAWACSECCARWESEAPRA
jgi:hypothetical protein